MNFISGILYNLRGVRMALNSPRLLFLGLLRFAIISIITVTFATMILVYHQEILTLIWTKPESRWLLWLWHLFSWLLSLLLVGLSTILSYLISQLVFSLLIMDAMSRTTERMITGKVAEAATTTLISHFFHLIRQEIPRTTIPVLLIMTIMVLGWFTPAAPLLSILSAGVAAVFLAWDHTDLTPARRLMPFGTRFKFLTKTLSFHLGFGLLFLVPFLNVVLLSFAPVGATLFFIETDAAKDLFS